MENPRRQFLKQSGLAAIAVNLFPDMMFSQTTIVGEGGDPILKTLTKINDGLIEDLLSQQVVLPGDRWDGGVADRFEVININSTVGFAGRLANSYTSPSSRYYLSSRLEAPMEKAMSCVLNVQHEDGTIDLHSTNFHSTPDAAFIVNYLSPVFVNLKRLDRPGLLGVAGKMEQFLRNAGK